MKYRAPTEYVARAIREIGGAVTKRQGEPGSQVSAQSWITLSRYAEDLELRGTPRENGPQQQCTDCSNCALVDNGYSNYTVEGTDVYCLLALHPLAPFDKWYDEDWRLDYAGFCPSFSEGTPAHIDVERYDASPEDLARWNDYCGGNR